MTHADERMNPVYDYQVNPCGPVYLNVGDGGNIGDLITGAAFESCLLRNSYSQLVSLLRTGFCSAEGLYKEYVDDPGKCPDPKSGQCVTKVVRSHRLQAALHQRHCAWHLLHTVPGTTHCIQQGAC